VLYLAPHEKRLGTLMEREVVYHSSYYNFMPRIFQFAMIAAA
jgi:hypothetical protein